MNLRLKSGTGIDEPPVEVRGVDLLLVLYLLRRRALKTNQLGQHPLCRKSPKKQTLACYTLAIALVLPSKSAAPTDKPRHFKIGTQTLVVTYKETILTTLNLLANKGGASATLR